MTTTATSPERAQPPLDQDAALVLLSGGQDSATCLAWALDRYLRVETVGFDYGQRHRVELEARERVRGFFSPFSALGPDHMLSLPTFDEIGETGMTADVEITWQEGGLPNTFVPGRNIAFLTFAGALGVRRGIGTLVGGMCGTDAAGYPDCRPATLSAMQTTVREGIHLDLSIETPLIQRSKAESWQLARELGGNALVEMIRTDTHTCYKGERSTLHEWGYGCGECPACVERARGWQAWMAASQSA